MILQCRRHSHSISPIHCVCISGKTVWMSLRTVHRGVAKLVACCWLVQHQQVRFKKSMISLTGTQYTELLAEFSVTSFHHSIKAAMVSNDFSIRIIYWWYVWITILHQDLWAGKFRIPYSPHKRSKLNKRIFSTFSRRNVTKLQLTTAITNVLWCHQAEFCPVNLYLTGLYI